MAYTVTQK